MNSEPKTNNIRTTIGFDLPETGDSRRLPQSGDRTRDGAWEPMPPSSPAGQG